MNTSRMRTIDFYLGGATCSLLDIYERIRRIFVRTATPTRIRNILVMKYLGMGSILLATPTLRELRKAYPECRIVFLTFEGNARLAERLGVIDEVRSLRTSSFPVFARDVLSTLARLRKERFDLVLDLEFFARFSTMVSYLSGAPLRIGYYLPALWRGHLSTHSIHFNPYRHVTEVFAAQLAPLGLTVTDFTLMPPDVSGNARRRVAALLRESGVGAEDRIIAVNVNASDLSRERRWPLKHFVSLLTAAARPGRRFILVGSSDEATYVGGLHAKLPGDVQKKVLDLAGRLSLDELIALLKNADLFITNDSGPLHIATALGVPTVSFFGPETPGLFGPIGPDHTTFYAGLYCSPCLNVYNAKRAMCNGDNQCMQAISADGVIKRLKEKNVL